MNELISKIFSERFIEKKNEFGFLYELNEKDKKEFWFVFAGDIKNVVNIQGDILQKCKEVNNDKTLEKNISLLVLWNTGGQIDESTLKREIMKLEENPFHFKKYVLYYSQREVDELKNVLDLNDVVKSISKNIISNDVFNEYKKGPLKQSWQSLLYRIAIKIPFIPILIEPASNFESLISLNKKSLKSSNLDEVNDLLFAIINKYTIDQISDKKFDSENLYNELLPFINEGF